MYNHRKRLGKEAVASVAQGITYFVEIVKSSVECKKIALDVFTARFDTVVWAKCKME